MFSFFNKKKKNSTMESPETEVLNRDEAETPEKPARDQQRADDPEHLKERVVSVLKTCYDPEIPIDIYELGLIYDVSVEALGKVRILMTLTTPNCPVAVSLPNEVKQKIEAIDGVNEVQLDIVWDPPWNPSMMSEAARLQLGFM